MTHHDAYPLHMAAHHGDPRDRESAREVIYQAVQLLRARHEVRESVAFTMLVQVSAESRTSVRETSHRLLTNASAAR